MTPTSQEEEQERIRTRIRRSNPRGESLVVKAISMAINFSAAAAVARPKSYGCKDRSSKKFY